MPGKTKRRNRDRRKRNLKSSSNKRNLKSSNIKRTIKSRRSSTVKSLRLANKVGGNDNKFTQSQCAPKKDKEMQKFSCYTKTTLLKMRDLWNKRHLDSAIKSSDPKEIWEQLKNKMAAACHSEACWLKQQFMENNLDDELTNFTFAPKSPSAWKTNHNTWLNSTDIEEVMKQYEHAYPCFRFIGPTPIDFDKHTYKNKCVWDDLCHFELSKFIKDGISKIGIIFNTDPHDKSGAHWISLFINLKQKYIFFFDSNGTEIPKQIKVFADRVIEQAKNLNINLTFDENAPKTHQEGNTECGMYSLYLIITLLNDTHPYAFFKKTKITDKAVENLRDRYYNNDL